MRKLRRGIEAVAISAAMLALLVGALVVLACVTLLDAIEAAIGRKPQ
jgi:hypothetical protein